LSSTEKYNYDAESYDKPSIDSVFSPHRSTAFMPDFVGIPQGQSSTQHKWRASDNL
jgi:hypothetical protein